MADHLARIIGTEKDKVNCSFYYKTGACRHGDSCTRTHLKPSLSQTLLLPHMYDNPPAAIALAGGTKLPEEMIKETIRHFEDFYEEVFLELANYGAIEDMIVCDNIGDHVIGNVYVKYFDEDDAERAMKNLTGRYYAGKLMMPEYSPVTNFRDGICRQYEEGSCSRGGHCNYMHLKFVSNSFKKSLIRQMYEEHPEYQQKKKERDSERRNKSPERSPRRRSRSPKKSSRRRSRSRSKGRDKDRDRGDRGDRDRDRKHKKKRSRSRSKRRSDSRDRGRDRSPESPKGKSGGGGGGFPRTSEERRAMIASWNQEAGGDNNE